MNTKIKNTVWILLLVVVALAACKNQSPEETLSSKTWELVSMGPEDNPNAIVSDSLVTIEFKFDEMSSGGLAGCNNYFAGFEVNGDEISFSAAGSTMMFCQPEELMAQEFAFLSALGEAHHFSTEDGQLTIQFGEGQILLFQ